MAADFCSSSGEKMLLACDGGRLSCGSAAWRRLSSMAAVSRLYSTRRLGPIVLMWPGGFAAGQHGGFFSRLCRSGGFAPLGSMAASSADYAGPAASRRWAARRLL